MPSLADLLHKSIPELRNIFIDRGRRVPQGLVEALEADSRHGAHQLAKRIRERRRSNRSEGQRLHSLLRFEIELWNDGYTLVAGVDEAGMAPLAGPVVAGAVILPQHYKLRGLNDSKKILDPEMRSELAQIIKRDALCWSFGFAEVEEIDRIGQRDIAGQISGDRACVGGWAPAAIGREAGDGDGVGMRTIGEGGTIADKIPGKLRRCAGKGRSVYHCVIGCCVGRRDRHGADCECCDGSQSERLHVCRVPR